MRRNRSPVRYIREQSREKSFSISSLSDCSLGRSPKPPGLGNDSQQRRYREGQYHEKINKHRKFDKSYERKRKLSRSRSRENVDQFYRSDRGRDSKEKYNLFRASTSHNTSDDVYQKPKASTSNLETKGKIKPDDRLHRLEQMVSFLVGNKSVQNSESEESSATNRYEFNPRNTTFTTSVWMNTINDECIERNFREKECIQFIQSKMTGLIKAWFKTLDLEDYTWPEIKMLIINTFPDNVDFASTLRLLINRYKKPEETITQYYFSKMYLLEACRITGANAVSVLVDGLNDSYWQKNARTHNFQTPEVFYTEFLSKLPNFGLQQMQAEEFLKSNVMDKGQVLSPPQPPQYDYGDPSYDILTLGMVDTVEDLRNNISSSRSEKYPRRIPKKDPKKRCYICAGFGHLAAKCPGGGKCFLCNKPGHIAAQCHISEDRSPY